MNDEKVFQKCQINWLITIYLRIKENSDKIMIGEKQYQECCSEYNI